MQRTSPDQPTVADLIAEAQDRLALGSHPERARLDAETLLLHILQQFRPDYNRAWLHAHRNTGLISRFHQRLSELVTRRVAGEPIQYITGECEFYGLPFKVTHEVLIPRPETEHLVEKVLKLSDHFERPRMVDIGTGSGAIAITLAHKLCAAEVVATDISKSALAIARENATLNHVSERIRFLQGDLLGPLAGERFEIVASNPPYVPEPDRPNLAVEVREYEPALALFAGEDGLDIYRRLIPAAHAALVPGGFLVVEIGFSQAAAIHRLLASNGFTAIDFTPDLQSILRVASAQRP